MEFANFMNNFWPMKTTHKTHKLLVCPSFYTYFYYFHSSADLLNVRDCSTFFKMSTVKFSHNIMKGTEYFVSL